MTTDFTHLELEIESLIDYLEEAYLVGNGKMEDGYYTAESLIAARKYVVDTIVNNFDEHNRLNEWLIEDDYEDIAKFQRDKLELIDYIKEFDCE